MKTNHKNIIIKGLLFISAAALVSACHNNDEAAADTGKQPYVIPDSLMKTLTIDTVKTSKVVDAIMLTGVVDFNQNNQVNIFPLVSGNIQDIKVQLGDYVQQGQVLAIVKSPEMAGYENNMIAAETNLTAAKKQLDAASDLFKSGLSSQLDLVTAQTNYAQAQAQLKMSQQVLKINSNNRDGNYIIKAPISGFIVQKNVTNNTAIRTDNGTNLFTISDLKNVWIEANVYESNIGKVKVGDSVNVTTLSYPNRIFKGQISNIQNVLDPSSKVMKVRVVLQNPDYALKPMMFANVEVSNNENKQGLTVPASALIFIDSRYYVLAYHGNGKADITPVQKLGSFGDVAYISDGVKEGDAVIGSNVIQIYDELNN